VRLVEVRFDLEVRVPGGSGDYVQRSHRIMVGAGGEVEAQILCAGGDPAWLTFDPGERVTMRVLALATRALAQRDRVPTRTVIVELGNLGPGQSRHEHPRSRAPFNPYLGQELADAAALRQERDA
jgi:hypothetical protein